MREAFPICAIVCSRARTCLLNNGTAVRNGLHSGSVSRHGQPNSRNGVQVLEASNSVCPGLYRASELDRIRNTVNVANPQVAAIAGQCRLSIFGFVLNQRCSCRVSALLPCSNATHNPHRRAACVYRPHRNRHSHSKIEIRIDKPHHSADLQARPNIGQFGFQPSPEAHGPNAGRTNIVRKTRFSREGESRQELHPCQ